jgi:hypothetical protein
MMEESKRTGTSLSSMLLTVLIWGGLWGIFEATVGYLLHMLPFSIGWLVWYPVACFFMLNVYRKTRQRSSIILIGSLAACIKLFNLLLPGSIDRVLNPSVSIVFEALSMTTVIWAVNHLFANRKRGFFINALAAISMNTIWRGFYILYLLFLVPNWIREISVISSSQAFIKFFIVHNLASSLILVLGSVIFKYILIPIKSLEQKLTILFSGLSRGRVLGVKIALAVLLLGSNIALELLL